MWVARIVRHFCQSTALVGSLLVMAAAVSDPARAATLVYGNEPRNPDLQRFTRWVGALNKHVSDMMSAGSRCAAGEQAYCFLINYDTYLTSIRSATPLEQIDAVNRFVNQVDYIEDPENYGTSDYWAAPLEFFQHGGDCEDFAIAKYVAFRRLGFSDDQVRIWVVRDSLRGVDHAVLTVAVDGHTYLLDSLNDVVREAADVNRYAPIYSINASAWWLHDMNLARTAIRTGAR